jgi:cell division transport system permease protein
VSSPLPEDPSAVLGEIGPGTQIRYATRPEGGRGIGYIFKEALGHIGAHIPDFIGAVLTVFLSFLLVEVIYVGGELIKSSVSQIESELTIQAFISDSVDEATAMGFAGELEGWDGVASVSYKSKSEALAEYLESVSDRESVAWLSEEVNPLPASLIITLSDPSLIDAVAAKLASSERFAELADDPADMSASIQYGDQLVSRLLSASSYITAIAVAAIAVFLFLAYVFINNTIRLSMASRGKEISIERRVGASDMYISGVFMAEAMIETAVGTILSVSVLAIAGPWAVGLIDSHISFLSLQMPPILGITIAVCAVAVTTGLIGSFVATRRYLAEAPML